MSISLEGAFRSLLDSISAQPKLPFRLQTLEIIEEAHYTNFESRFGVLSTGCPDLETLRLKKPTELKAPEWCSAYAYALNVRELPRGLKSLWMVDVQITSIDGWPTSLTSVHFVRHSAKNSSIMRSWVSSLPSSVTNLVQQHMPLSGLDLSRLPVSLESLSLSLESFGPKQAALLGDTKLSYLRLDLPHGTTNLSPNEEMNVLRALPHGLTFLSLPLKHKSISLAKLLPRSLTSLCDALPPWPPQSIPFLPPKLHDLSLDIEEDSPPIDCSRMERLQTLYLSGHSLNTKLALPPNVKSLDLGFTYLNLDLILPLPESLTDLYIAGMVDFDSSEVSISALPRNLTSLTLSNITAQSFLDSKDLPRSLRVLSFEAGFTLPELWFQGLPEGLDELDTEVSSFSLDSPMSCERLRHLVLLAKVFLTPLGRLLEHLPRNLLNLYLSLTGDETELESTLDDLSHLPPNLKRVTLPCSPHFNVSTLKERRSVLPTRLHLFQLGAESYQPW
jgi:hypothetical protein